MKRKRQKILYEIKAENICFIRGNLPDNKNVSKLKREKSMCKIRIYTILFSMYKTFPELFVIT